MDRQADRITVALTGFLFNERRGKRQSKQYTSVTTSGIAPFSVKRYTQPVAISVLSGN